MIRRETTRGCSEEERWRGDVQKERARKESIRSEKGREARAREVRDNRLRALRARERERWTWNV